jgi:NitT/TauT family transport system substrate-binding protein
MHIMRSRRDFISTLSAAGAAGILGGQETLADEGLPETTTVRIFHDPSICVAPGQIADSLLRAEGFTDIRYVETSHIDAVARGEVDFSSETAAWVVAHVAAGDPIIALAGIHPGCYELFVHEPIRTISDLRGRRVGIPSIGGSGHLLLTTMVAQVGLNPHRDIDWISTPTGTPMEMFAERQVDAFLGFPPEPQQLRARKIGRVILKTATDRPWSQYLCCMIYGNRAWVRDHPMATKRFLRALYKAADFCSAEPAAAARRLVDGGFTENYDYALQTIEEVPYDRWHEYDSEDSLRFYALRLHEVGMISANPRAILAEGTDWRFVNELRRELKA